MIDKSGSAVSILLISSSIVSPLKGDLNLVNISYRSIPKFHESVLLSRMGLLFFFNPSNSSGDVYAVIG